MIEFIDTFFSWIGILTNAIRNMVMSIANEWTTLVLLIMSGVGGYYLYKKYPDIKGIWVGVMYALIIFLMLKFI